MKYVLLLFEWYFALADKEKKIVSQQGGKQRSAWLKILEGAALPSHKLRSCSLLYTNTSQNSHDVNQSKNRNAKPLKQNSIRLNVWFLALKCL